MHRHVARGRARSGPRGFTLIELLLAAVIVVASGVWVMGAFQSALHLSEVSRQVGTAVTDLDDMLERIKATPFTQLATDFPNGAANGIVGGGADRYGGIIGGYTLGNEQIVVTNSPSTAADPREVIVQVSWTNRNRTYQRTLRTVRSSQAS